MTSRKSLASYHSQVSTDLRGYLVPSHLEVTTRMHKLFGRKPKKNEKEANKHVEKQSRKPSSISPPNQHNIVVYGADNKLHTSLAKVGQEAEGSSPSPTGTSQDMVGELVSPDWAIKSTSSINRRDSGMKVAAHKAYFEDLNLQSSITSPGSSSPRRVSSPEKRRRDREDPTVSLSSNHSTSMVSPAPGGNRTPSFADRFSRPISGYMGSSSPANKRLSRMSGNFESTEVGREKSFDGVMLPLPPLQTTAVRLREVDARRNPLGGGFGFILRKSYLPVPEEPDKTKLVHLIEPRPDYFGPLMTGDRIIEVNGELVEDAPHETVVDMIKASEDFVGLKVASMPELVELNNRGALDGHFERNSGHRKSGKAKQGTGSSVCTLQ